MNSEDDLFDRSSPGTVRSSRGPGNGKQESTFRFVLFTRKVKIRKSSFLGGGPTFLPEIPKPERFLKSVQYSSLYSILILVLKNRAGLGTPPGPQTCLAYSHVLALLLVRPGVSGPVRRRDRPRSGGRPGGFPGRG